MPIDEDGINRDANGYDYAFHPAARIARQQKVLNESWPMRDDKGKHARGIGDRPIDEQRQVWARIVFDLDGETILPGRAARWTDMPSDRAHVYVIIDDPRVPGQAVWLRFVDIQPRD